MNKITLTLLVSVSVVASLFSNTVNARSCSSEEYDKADYISEQAGMEIIDSYGGVVTGDFG